MKAFHSTVIDELLRASKRWGWLLALGIVIVLLGVAALGSTVIATLATVTFLGALIAIVGAVEVFTAFTSREWRGFGLGLVSGLLAILVGVMFMIRPDVAAGVLTLVLAVLLLVSGFARAIYALAERYPSWGWSLFSGLVAIALGVMVFAEFPTSAFWFLGLAVAVELLFRGSMWIALAIALHRVAPRLESLREPTATTPAASA